MHIPAIRSSFTGAGARVRPADKLAARAILILLVIIGHNRLLRDHFYYTAYIAIYAFHVGAFFLLAAIAPPRAIDRKSITSLLAKIVLPFLVFTLIYAVLAQAAGETKTDGGWESLPAHYLEAITLANTPILDAVTGLKMLWFLPTFFVFCLLYNLYGSLGGWARAGALLVALAAHLFAGAIVPTNVRMIPWGAHIAAYLLLPALAFRILAPRIFQARLTAAGCVALFGIATAIAINNQYELILADSRMAGVARPFAMIVGDAQLVFGTATCLIAARWLSKFEAVQRIGANSLKLYLLHPAFNVAALLLFGRYLPWPIAMVLVSLCAIAGTIVLAAVVDRIPQSRRVLA